MKSKYTKELLQPVVLDSHSISEVVRKLTNNNKAHGSMVKYVGDKIRFFGIDMSHFNGRNWSRGKINPHGTAYTKDEFVSRFLVENSPFIRSVILKEKLFKFNILENKCASCGLVGRWNGKKITLQIDHIDGDNNNNKITNLRIMCPNCHSQTKTYTGRNNKRHTNR